LDSSEREKEPVEGGC